MSQIFDTINSITSEKSKISKDLVMKTHQYFNSIYNIWTVYTYMQVTLERAIKISGGPVGARNCYTATAGTDANGNDINVRRQQLDEENQGNLQQVEKAARSKDA